MKKVLFIATVVQKHINVFHLPFLKMFQDEGYRTYVAASNDTDEKNITIPYCDEYTDIAFQRNPLHPGNFSAYKKLRNLIQNNDFDIIHCHTPVGGLLGRLAARSARKKGTRVIYTAHGFHFYKGAPWKNWLFYYPVEKICSFFTDVLITINQEDFNLAKLKMRAKKIEYVPGVGIDFLKYRDVQVDKVAKRMELGIPEDAFLLISVGELSKRKNHKIILEAMTKIDNARLHYAVVGNGNLRSDLEEFASSHNISDKVHFLGYRKDVAEIYKVSDACCFPSIHEGLPVALMEGMASGLPVVCSKIRGITDLIDETRGVFFNPNDSNECSHAIMDILNADIVKMGEKNQQYVRNFSIEKIINIMKNIYES